MKLYSTNELMNEGYLCASKWFNNVDGNDPVHVKLAELSKSAHEKASSFIQDNPPKQELSAIHLGRMRTSLKKHLVKELGEIDRIVKGVIGK